MATCRRSSTAADDVASPAVAVDVVVVEGCKPVPHFAYVGRPHRYVVGIAVHEAHAAAIRSHLGRVTDEQGAATLRAVFPVQRGAAGEMSTCAHKRNSAAERQRITAPELDGP